MNDLKSKNKGWAFMPRNTAQPIESSTKPAQATVTASAERKWTHDWSVAATFEGEFSQVAASYAGKGVVRYAW